MDTPIVCRIPNKNIVTFDIKERFAAACMAFSVNGKNVLFVIGGDNPGSSATETYLESTGKWEDCLSLPRGFWYGSQGTYPSSHEFLVIGGDIYWIFYLDIVQYNQDTNIFDLLSGNLMLPEAMLVLRWWMWRMIANIL